MEGCPLILQKNRAHITVWFSVLFFSNSLIIPIPKNLASGTCLITIYKSLSILYTFQIQRNNYWRNFLPPHYNTLYFLTSWLLTKNCGCGKKLLHYSGPFSFLGEQTGIACTIFPLWSRKIKTDLCKNKEIKYYKHFYYYDVSKVRTQVKLSWQLFSQQKFFEYLVPW